jgi:hypothetical protein
MSAKCRGREHRLRDGDQIPTVPVTILEIMRQPTFVLGVADVRNGRGYHDDYDRWDTNGQWGYERGRHWATLTPRHVPLKLNGKINPKAAFYYSADMI